MGEKREGVEAKMMVKKWGMGILIAEESKR